MNSDDIKKLRKPKTREMKVQKSELSDDEMGKIELQELESEPCTFVLVMGEVLKDMFT